MFLIFLSACKKDEDSSVAFTLETTSLDFEWGQTKELTFTTKRVHGFDAPVVPSGWTCTLGDNRFIITAPPQGDSPQLSLKIKLTARTETGTALEREVTVSVRLAEELTGAANSFIVSEPGKRYKFNARRRGNETAETITGATGATRLWTTSASAVVNVSLENGYIYFATGNTDELTEGNTLVAVTDSDGKILWSWHIWSTGYNPAAEPDYFDDIPAMNRNLGAFANSNATPEDAVRSYGLYYQWGRKDPFIGPVAWNSTTPHPLYNRYGSYMTHTYAVSDSEVGSVEYSIANPNTFIAGNKDNGFDWLASSNENLWSTTSKTLYDPCPAGWKVAPPSIWAAFTTMGAATSDPAEFSVEGEYNYGWTFVVDDGLQYHPPLNLGDPMPDHFVRIFYPAAGRRSFSPSLANSSDNFTNVVNDGEGVGYPVGFYWSSEHPAHATANPTYPIEGAGSLVFRRDYVNPSSRIDDVTQNAPSGGFPLRCVAE